MTVLPPDELAHLHRAIDLAREARLRGDHPFGSTIVTAGGATIDGLNSVRTANDPTGHAETNAVRAAAAVLSTEELAGATLYTSTEPCAMCAGAIYWSGIGRVVYALGEDELIRLVAAQEDIPTLMLPCREVFARGGRHVDVVGPVAIGTALDVHEGFWS